MFYDLKTKPNFQPLHEMGSGEQVIVSVENYWPLIMRPSTANKA